MKTIIIDVAIRVLVPLFFFFSMYMFFRGHNSPGGGFIAGLICSIPFIVHAITFGSAATKFTYKVKPIFLSGLGLFLAFLSGVFALIDERPFMSSYWIDEGLFFIPKLGTPLLFDLGVFLVVFGVVVQVAFLFCED